MIVIDRSRALVRPVWRGARCFIVAGGPSARDALGRIRPGENIIAVKHAGQLFPNAGVLFWAGKTWHKEAEAKKTLYGMNRATIFVKRKINGLAPILGRPVYELDRVPGGSGLCLDPGAVSGWDAGGSALNLAYHLGAAEIVLYGLDYGGRHWLGDRHPLPDETEALHKLHCEGVEAMASALQDAGVRVFNASKQSRLQCFPAWEG
jgi:hypothetical protein